MSAAELLQQLRAKSVRFKVVGGELRVEAPRGVLTPAELDAIRAHKPAFLTLLTEQTRVVLVDFETRSLSKLKTVGARTYASDATTSILCAVLRMPDGETIEWEPSQSAPERVFELVRRGVPVVAHNVDFDRLIWHRLGWPEPVRWIDTLALAKMAGHAGRSLDELGQALLGRSKDNEGGAFTLSLSKPERKTKLLRRLEPNDLDRVIRYCARDVELLAGIYQSLAALERYEPEVRAVDRRINDRGFCFDVELARAVIECEEESCRLTRQNAGVPSEVLSSPIKLKRELAKHAVEVQSVNKETLARVLGDGIPDEARWLIEARLTSAPTSAKKLRTALRRVGPDNRIRDSLAYYAAHTGRWGGRGFQPQNLPRGVSELDLEGLISTVMRRDLPELREVATKRRVGLTDVIATLVRLCVCAPHGRWLGVVDYAQVEARALAWLACDIDALNLFREGRDPYRILASKLFGVPPEQVTGEQRKLGKMAELGCGYGMGDERFALQASAAGVDWTAANVTPEQVVQTWRDAHPAIAGIGGDPSGGRIFRVGGLWRELEQAALAATKGRRVQVGPLVFGRNGDCVVCVLPSSRRLVYRDARIEKLPHSKINRPQFTYTNARGKRESGYGGKLAENVTQAICRDVLAESLVRLDRAGFDVVLHVHDEIVAELKNEDQLGQMRDLMITAPIWATDLPLAADGHVARRYSK